MRKRQWFVIMLLLMMGFAVSVDAAKVGKANLFVRQQETTDTQAFVEVGDVLAVEIFADGQDESVTGVAIHLNFDDRFLELIPADVSLDVVFPFKQGSWLQGAVFGNNTSGDAIGNSSLNKIPMFQLYYNEDIVPQNGIRQGVIGQGVVATAQFRVIQRPEVGFTEIRVVKTSPVGSETGYFIQEDPGGLYGFRGIRDLVVTIQGFSVDIRVADFNGNGTVDFPDFLDFVGAFGSDQSKYDFDGSGTVDFPDFLKFASVFGQVANP